MTPAPERPEYGVRNPAPGTRLWRFRNHPETLTDDDLLQVARDLDDLVLATAPVTDAGLREELDRLIGASQLAGSLSKDGWTEGFIGGVEAVRQWLDERAALSRQAEKETT